MDCVCNYTIKLYAALGRPERSLMHLRHNNCVWVLSCCPKWLAETINGFIIICSSHSTSISAYVGELCLCVLNTNSLRQQLEPSLEKSYPSCPKLTSRSTETVSPVRGSPSEAIPISPFMSTSVTSHGPSRSRWGLWPWTDSYEAENTQRDLIPSLFCVKSLLHITHW